MYLYRGPGGRMEEPGTIRVFLGSYVHSLSKDQPLAIMPNGVIGVKDGKVRTHAYALPKDAHFY
jgi:hypothetical protein